MPDADAPAHGGTPERPRFAGADGTRGGARRAAGSVHGGDRPGGDIDAVSGVTRAGKVDLGSRSSSNLVCAMRPNPVESAHARLHGPLLPQAAVRRSIAGANPLGK